MSNIGKQRIVLPKDLFLSIHGWKLSAKGPHGKGSIIFPFHTRILRGPHWIQLKIHNVCPSIYGSLQRKLEAFLYGLSLLYVVNIVFVGVGYRARVEEDLLILRLGFSHEVSLKIPSTIRFQVVKRNILRLDGVNYESLRHFAYRLRSFRPPEPFKGKGVIVDGEKIRRKEGKKKKV